MVNFKSIAKPLLSSAYKDHHFSKSKTELTNICKLANPVKWNKFATGSKVINIVGEQKPKTLVVL